MLSNIVTNGSLFGNISQHNKILLNIIKYCSILPNIEQYYQIYRGYMDIHFDYILHRFLGSDIVK